MEPPKKKIKQDIDGQATISDLPNEVSTNHRINNDKLSIFLHWFCLQILFEVFDHLPFYKRIELSQVCKKWNDIIIYGSDSRRVVLNIDFSREEGVVTKWSNRHYTALSSSNITSQDALKTLITALHTFGNGLESFRFVISPGNQFRLFHSLILLPELRELHLSFEENVRKSDFFPLPSKKKPMAFSKLRVLHIDIDLAVEYSDKTAEGLMNLIKMCPQLEELSINRNPDLIINPCYEEAYLKLIKSCSANLKKLVYSIRTDSIWFSLAKLCFPKLEEMDLLGFFHNSSKDMKAVFRKMQNTFKKIQLKLEYIKIGHNRRDPPSGRRKCETNFSFTRSEYFF